MSQGAIGEDGVFRGIASVVGSIVDSVPPTIVERGAFTETLAADAKRVKILWQHQVDEPIGKPVSMIETDRGLELGGKISQTARGMECLSLMRDGVLTDLSIGFDPIEWWFDEQGVRHLTAVKLFEISVVTWGADKAAGLSHVGA